TRSSQDQPQSRLLLPARSRWKLVKHRLSVGQVAVSAVSNSASGSASLGLSNSPGGSSCAVCFRLEDVASGVHLTGFFRRIVSSRNPAGACSHASPLAITPQTRNACQWCRLKKCCAVNMGRQRSKLGRRARLDADNGNGGRGVGGAKRRTQQPPSPSSVDAETISDQQLLRFIELKRREFENQVCRRTCFRRQASLNSDKSPVTSCARDQLLAPTSIESRRHRRHLTAAAATAVGILSEAWLTGCQPLLSGQSLVRLCHRLTGDTDSRSAAWLCSLCDRPDVSGDSAKLILCAVDKFVQYWEADLNDQFSQNPVCGRAIAESTELILEGHRRTAYFCQDRMSKFRAERLPMLREPAIGEEAAVLNHLVGCIPQLMLRIVAFARNILGSSAAAHGHSDQQQLNDSDHNRVLASRCSDVLLDSDKRRLIVHHCFKVIAMRFCDALIQSGEGYIIDPALHYRLTKEFLATANHPMLSQLFLKFFDVSTVWDSHGVTEQELAFLSAICLTSPFLDSKNDAFSSSSETQFDDANAVVSVHSAVIGLFWIHLRSAEMTRRGCDPAKVKLDSRLNLELRVQALSRIMDLSAVFDALQSVDGVHKQNEAMIDSIVERLSASCSTSGLPDGFPDFSAAFNPVGHPAPDPQRLNQYGAGVYQEPLSVGELLKQGLNLLIVVRSAVQAAQLEVAGVACSGGVDGSRGHDGNAKGSKGQAEDCFANHFYCKFRDRYKCFWSSSLEYGRACRIEDCRLQVFEINKGTGGSS
uniref:Nuclear receptor domain-containing protein n=1 Tax=Macrostomum lignano TaxID=282301 RepID=A0A1I8J6P2_9PLAT